MDWTAAARVAMFKAARVHRTQNSDLSKWVDVFGILANTGVALAFRPMGRLEAAALNESEYAQGVIVNANRPLHRQRYSAAHELGHLQFNHETSLDLDELMERGPRGRWTDNEKLAESFAAWFLMPHVLIEYSMKRLGVTRIMHAADVYQLALRMGTSYESTARHLVNANFCSRALCDTWLKVEPTTLKRQAAGVFLPDTMRNDVHILGRLDNAGSQLVRSGDRVVIRLDEKPTSGYRWRFEPLPEHVRIVDDSYVSTSKVELANEFQPTGGVETRQFVLEVNEPESTADVSLVLTERRAWERESIAKTTFDLTIETAERLGVPHRYFTAA